MFSLPNKNNRKYQENRKMALILKKKVHIKYDILIATGNWITQKYNGEALN